MSEKIETTEYQPGPPKLNGNGSCYYCRAPVLVTVGGEKYMFAGHTLAYCRDTAAQLARSMESAHRMAIEAMARSCAAEVARATERAHRDDPYRAAERIHPMTPDEAMANVDAARNAWDAARREALTERERDPETAYRNAPRPPGCQCHWEAGDSPCPVHGDGDA